MRSSTILLLCFLALPLSAHELVREYDLGVAPGWVERLVADTRIEVARENARWGIFDILSDHQVRAGDGGEWQYFRVVRKVLSPSGVQNASELSLDFDPTFERLVLHDIIILRGASRIDALRAAEIRVIDKEDDAENRIYDGTRTTMVFLKDVRPGDVIDYSYSLEGQNPLLDGRYTDEYDLSSGVPAQRLRHRLVWPAGRPLQWKGEDPAIAVTGGEQTLTWEAADVPALDVEDSIPSWLEPWRSVQVTEFSSWREVALWADGLFRLDERSIAEVRQLAGEIRAGHSTREARITAAIRFVQDDIRYLGIEMGRNSHEPHQPWETLETRWGDCKDKTILLVGLLRELGLEAHPALVNTRLRHRLQEKLPSPFLFDHVIAQVIDGGKTYWVDGTISDQGGGLATIATPSDGHSLVVRSDTSSLTAIQTSAQGNTTVEQFYDTADYGKPVSLLVRTTWSGTEADSMRSTLSSYSIEDLASERINALAVDQPRIEARGLPTIADDRARNVIVMTEKYLVTGMWDEGDWTWYPRVLESHLTRPDTMIRKMPLAFPHPLDVRQTVTFNFPEVVEVEQSTSVTETATFRHEYVVDQNGKTVTIRQSLRSLRDFVEAKDVSEHLTKLNGIWSEIAFRLAPQGAARRPTPSSGVSPAVKWSLGLFMAFAFIGLSWLLATRRPRLVPAVAYTGFRPGEAPASAVAVRGEHEMHTHLATISCACGATSYSAADVQRAFYDEREMTIITRLCGSCGREQAVYFTAA